jgi:large subunit ribosomal protein L4
MSTTTFTKTGNKSPTTTTLSKEVFAVEVKNHELLKQAYLSHQAGKRTNNAVTKLRGEVRGGGRKPHKQKGTGRARAGSIRSPLWRGGGVTFGPSGNENYSKKLNKKARLNAIKQALSLKNTANQVTVIDTFETSGKVKSTVDLMKKIEAKGRVLLVVSEFDSLVDRATRNVANLKSVEAKYLNVVDILDADKIIISKNSLEVINEWLVGKKL